MNHRPDPLTAEERALADRLAKIAPARIPSGDIDARILRAGRDAAAATRRRPSPGRRWPAVAGLAATLALAVGIAWQLRPMAEAPEALGEAPVAAAAPASEELAVASARRSSGDTAPAMPVEPPPPASPARTAASPGVAPAGSPPDDAARQSITKQPTRSPALRPVTRSAATAAAAPEAEVAKPSTAFRAAAAVPPPPPAPPAPPAPVSDRDASSFASERSAAQAASLRASREREPAAQPGSPVAAVQARRSPASSMQAAPPTVTAPAVTALTVTDLPVTSDAGLAPTVWIERIRQRRDAGDPAGARASLEQLRAAHPDVSLPADLRQLADVAPPAGP